MSVGGRNSLLTLHLIERMMLMQIRQALLKKGHRVRPGGKLTAKYLTIHSTGNKNSTADSERRWLDNPSNTREASWHICIDEKEVVQAIPFTEVAWHAGSGNKESIGIEICESGNRQATLAKAAECVADLLIERGWGVEKLRRHYDWTQKNCPSIMSQNNWAGWNQFKEDVDALIQKKKSPKAPQWQIEALEAVRDKLNLDRAYWTPEKLTEPLTKGEFFGILNKIV